MSCKHESVNVVAGIDQAKQTRYGPTQAHLIKITVTCEKCHRLLTFRREATKLSRDQTEFILVVDLLNQPAEAPVQALALDRRILVPGKALVG